MHFRARLAAPSPFVTSRWGAACAAAVILAVATVAFRLPALVNAAATNSDAAIVGLQARHILEGHGALHLYGSHYQTSVDSYWVAAVFAAFGSSPLALMAAPLALHGAVTLAVFAALRRLVGSAGAFLLALPLVFTTAPVHTYVLYVPRQASLTLAMVAACFLVAPRRGPSKTARAASGVLASLAVYADPYALVFALPLALMAMGAGIERLRKQPQDGRGALRDLGTWAMPWLAGASVGALPIAYLWSRPEAHGGVRSVTFDAWQHHGQLLVEVALPWLVGLTTYRGSSGLDYAPWDPPFAFRGLAIVGAAGAASILVASAFVVTRKSLCGMGKDGLRASFAFGASLIVVTASGFLVSVMVMDLFSARYLAAAALALPFAAAPAVAYFGLRRAALALGPYVAATAVSGWVSFGPFVRGLDVVATDAGRGRDVEAMTCALERRGVHEAVADYWTAYRFTFVAGERIVVVPLHAAEDRFAPYRDKVRSAPVLAYVYDPGRSRERFDEGLLLAGGGEILEILGAGGLRAAIVRQRPPALAPVGDER